MTAERVELAEAGRLVGDVRDAADFRRMELKESLSCGNCGSLEPVRLENGVCSDCADFPTCLNCGRWVGDGAGWLPGYVNVQDENGQDAKLCEPCLGEVA